MTRGWTITFIIFLSSSFDFKMTWHKALYIPVKEELLFDFPLPSFPQSIYNLSIHLLIRQSTCAPAVRGEKVCGRMKVSLLSIIKFLRRFSMMTDGSERRKLLEQEKEDCSKKHGGLFAERLYEGDPNQQIDINNCAPSK